MNVFLERFKFSNFEIKAKNFEFNYLYLDKVVNRKNSDYRQQMIGRFNRSVQSVCRQCFNPCDPSDTNDGGAYCFGGSHTKNTHKGKAPKSILN